MPVKKSESKSETNTTDTNQSDWRQNYIIQTYAFSYDSTQGIGKHGQWEYLNIRSDPVWKVVVTEKYTIKDKHWQSHKINQSITTVGVLHTTWDKNRNAGKRTVSA